MLNSSLFTFFNLMWLLYIKEINAGSSNLILIYLINTNYDLFNNAFNILGCVVSNGGIV
jgi:hypothetical protein